MFRASYNSRKKLSAVVLYLYLPFEQTAVIEFKKNTRFDNLALKDICYYEKYHLKYQRVKNPHLYKTLNNQKASDSTGKSK